MKRYDLIIIGGGVAGLVSASGASQLGARVALIEKLSLGGDCLRAGCVPTKRLIESAKVASAVKGAGRFGLRVNGAKVDFSAVMESMRKVQAKIGENDAPERFRSMGVEVVFGSGRFTDPHTFEVNGQRLWGRRFIIATGSSPLDPAMLSIPGLKEAGTLNNESALELERLPQSIIILGGGPIGVEFGQIFARLGSKVTIIERHGQLLSREDKELAEMLGKALVAEGIDIEFGFEVKEVVNAGGKKAVYGRSLKGDKVFRAEEIMLAAGRTPNVGGLNLEAAGVEYDKKKGIKADKALRTTQKHIFACGDVAGPYAFTHVAEYHAGIALGNALFPIFMRKADYRVVPWTTFSDPELARVGLTEDEARARFGEDSMRVYRFPFKKVDRAVIEEEPEGLIKLVCDTKGRILGAHILGPGAGELLPEYVLAMRKKIPVKEISRSIHVYPTVAQGLKRAADEYYRAKLFTGWFPKIARFIVRRGR
ncbi:MAG: FAD-dependent oxidoreductase [Deltaproteobacteria bacterium]|nr:FAD-dependent oxidoreductase [Deltaproteobacteria bacterium]